MLYQVKVVLQMMNCEGRVCAYFKVVLSGETEEAMKNFWCMLKF